MQGRLTTTELACVRAAGDGLRDKEIARLLKIRSHRTVQRHLHEAYRKLEVRDRRSAAEKVRRDYAEIPILIPDIEPVGTELGRPAAEPYRNIGGQGLPWFARVWRPPPTSPWTRLGLIVIVAVLWSVFLSGGLSIIQQVLAATDQFRPSR